MKGNGQSTERFTRAQYDFSRWFLSGEKWIEDAGLSETDVMVLQSVFIHGFSQARVAAELGVSQATISKRIQRALDKMYDYFKPGQKRPPSVTNCQDGLTRLLYRLR